MCPPKFLCGVLTPEGTEEVGSQKVIKSWGWSPREWDACSCKRPNAWPSLPPCEDTARSLVTQERALPHPVVALIMGFQPIHLSCS